MSNKAIETLKSLLTEQEEMRKRVAELVRTRSAKDYEIGGVIGVLENLKDELERAISELEHRM